MAGSCLVSEQCCAQHEEIGETESKQVASHGCVDGQSSWLEDGLQWRRVCFLTCDFRAIPFGQLEIIVGWPALTAYSPVTSEPLLRISWIL